MAVPQAYYNVLKYLIILGVLTLSLSGNPLNCDEKMQWAKVSVEEGWLKWMTSPVDGQPQCVNFPFTAFEDIKLVRTTTGEF